MAILDKLKSFQNHAGDAAKNAATAGYNAAASGASATMGAAGAIGTLATGAAGSAQDQVKDFTYKFLTNATFREFVLYLCFVVTFTFSVFAAKPGETQFLLQEMASDHFADYGADNYYNYLKFYDIADEGGMWDFLEQRIPDFLWPQINLQGEPLGDIERMFIIGQGRTLGSYRLRQVRSELKECNQIPKWLREVGSHEVLCPSTFNWDNMEKRPFNDTVPHSWNKHDTLHNFTQPFTFRSAEQLNSTDLGLDRGYFGAIYPQSGYSVDFAPNLAPHYYAARVQACMPLMQASIESCRRAQQVEYDVVLYPPPPPQLLSPPPLMLGENGGPGMVLTEDGSVSFVSALTKNFNLDATRTADQYVFKLHNPGALNLTWEFDAESSAMLNDGTVPWITSLSPQQDNPVPPMASTDCTPADCDGLSFEILVGQDAWMRAQSNPNEMAQTMKHQLYEVTLVLRSKDFSDLAVSVTLRMTYNVPAGFVGTPQSDRRRLQQVSVDSNSSICVERLELLTSNYQQDDLIIPTALDLDACGLAADVDHSCELQEMGFQNLLGLMNASVCGNCKCKPGNDPYCLQHCSPRAMYFQQLAQLKAHRWTDLQTRAVFLDFSILYPHFNLMQAFRLTFEMYEAGGIGAGTKVRPAHKVRTFRIFRYVTTWDFVVGISEVAVVVFTLMYTGQTVYSMAKYRWAYFYEPWHYVDMALLAVMYTVMALRAASFLIMSDFDFDSLTSQHVDLYPLGFIAIQEVNVSAINFLVFYFKLFRYIGQAPRMGIIFQTLQTAAFDLLLFCIMFVLCVFAFATAFYVVFSADARSVKTLSDAMGALLRMMIGDFDYAELSEANGIMAPILFYAFVFCVVLILMNMFLGILADAYAEVKGGQGEDDLRFYSNLRTQILGAVQELFSKRDRIRELTRELETADLNADGMVDMAELEAVLASNPRALEILKAEGVEEIMKKYDVSNDGLLSRAEMTAVMRELAEKEAELQAETANAHVPPHSTTAHAERSQETLAFTGASGGASGGGGNGGGGTGGGGVAGGAVMFSGGLMGSTEELEQRIEKVDLQIKDMSRNVAKKLSLMIDLMMSLSDQVGSVSGVPSASRGNGSQLMGSDANPAIMPPLR